MTESVSKKYRNDRINKVLLIQTAFIGDVILITPLIREIKRIFPDSKLDVMVIPQAANLLENNPNVNSIIKFDKKRNKLSAFLKTYKQLKKERYDLAISPHSSLTSALLMYFSRIGIRVGFARWTSQYLLTDRLKHLKGVLKIRKNLHLLSPFTDENLSVQTELFPTEDMFAHADELLSDIKQKTKRIIAVAPGSNWFTKRWPLEHYNELVNKLNEENYGVVFIGSPQERGICEEILPETNAINLAGQLNLSESAAVVSRCDLMVCNDSGAMHIANAVETDVFVFFGPTVQRIGYSPIRKNDVVFEIDLDCRPCSSHGTKKCPLEHFKCMKDIKSIEVFKKIQKKFE